MQKQILFWAITLFMLAGLSTLTQAEPESLYTVHSKDVGWATLNMTISEKERREKSSLLEITKTTQMLALQGKFLFCYVFRLAQQRGFRYTKWSKVQENTKDIFVIFLESEDESLDEDLKKERSNYPFYDHPMDLEEWEWTKLQESCGF